MAQETKGSRNRRTVAARVMLIGVLVGTLTMSVASGTTQQPDLPQRAIAQAAQVYNIPAERLTVVNSAWLGRSIYRAKVLDEATGEIFVASLRSSGESMSEEEVNAFIEAEREKGFIGKIEARLKQKLLDNPAGTTQVVIWVRTPDLPRDTWRASLEAGNREAVLNEARTIHSQAKAPVIQSLRSLSARINYDSELTPIIVADIPNALLSVVENLPQVARIYAIGHPEPDLKTSIKTIKADQVWAAGITGAGVKVAIVESTNSAVDPGSAISTANPYLGPIASSAYYAPSSPQYSRHAAYVAGVVASTNSTYKGVSHGVFRPNDLFSGNGTDPGSGGLLAATDWAVNNGANAINQSWGDHPDIVCEPYNTDPLCAQCNLPPPPGQRICPSYDFPQPCPPISINCEACCWRPGLTNSIDFSTFAIHDDYLIRTYLVTIACSAGNDVLKPVKSPANGYNVIAVGSFDHNQTKSWSDDIFSGFSSHMNPKSPHNDREKPDIVAPGHVYSTTNGTDGTSTEPWIFDPSNMNHPSGTSFAAPHVAGTAALLMQAKPSLKTRPDELKAVLMASAIHNISGSTRLSDEDGAGGLVAKAAYDTVINGWSSYVPISVSPGPISFNVTAGQTVRFVISWLSSADPGAGTDTIKDLNLSVKKPNGTVVATSASFDNSFEIVEFVAPATGTYTAVVSRAGISIGPFPDFGWAYYLQ